MMYTVYNLYAIYPVPDTLFTVHPLKQSTMRSKFESFYDEM